jgi:hypothetical protein
VADRAVICLNPGPVNGVPYKPWRFRDAPGAVAAKQAVDPKSQAIVVSLCSPYTDPALLM